MASVTYEAYTVVNMGGEVIVVNMGQLNNNYRGYLAHLYWLIM